MMTPMHADLVKHSTPTALTAHERQALRTRRKIRRAAILACIERVISHTARSKVMLTQPRFNSPS